MLQTALKNPRFRDFRSISRTFARLAVREPALERVRSRRTHADSPLARDWRPSSGFEFPLLKRATRKRGNRQGCICVPSIPAALPFVRVSNFGSTAPRQVSNFENASARNATLLRGRGHLAMRFPPGPKCFVFLCWNHSNAPGAAPYIDECRTYPHPTKYRTKV